MSPNAPVPLPLPHRTLSVIVPIFNEAATLRTALDAIVAKTVAGWDLELIFVESNSTDGSRAIVETYRAEPRVTLIFEDKPRGKGYAVRNALARATGEFILIQDADLEYSLDDYEKLLLPLAAGTHTTSASPSLRAPSAPMRLVSHMARTTVRTPPAAGSATLAMSTSPLTAAASTGGMPLYGTCVALVPASVRSRYSAVSWGVVPEPGEP
jgi:glycosyltransferase involved in cell wall biosynthesis